MNLVYHSTRNSEETATASEAILKGLTSDGGLFVPDSIPKLNVALEDLTKMSYQEIAYAVMKEFLTDFTEEELKTCINNAYDSKFDTEEIAVTKKVDGAYYLELFHGATIAFKDMALSILPHLLVTSARKNNVKNEIVILTATSGDTGNASITGAIEKILMTSGIGGEVFDIVFEIVDGVYDVAIASGIQVIIFLSGLQTISTSMYEAADIDGCTKWESLWKITFPMISPLFLVNWIYTIVDFCMRSDNEVMEKISDTMIVDLNYGFASAMAWSYFLIVIAIIGISSLIISKGVYYYD